MHHPAGGAKLIAGDVVFYPGVTGQTLAVQVDGVEVPYEVENRVVKIAMACGLHRVDIA